MDAFLKKIERLADMAAREQDPKPLDASLIMAKIREIPSEAVEEEENFFSFRLFAEVGAAAAAAAVFVFVFAASAWTDINSPVAVMESLMEVMESTL